MTTFVLIHAAFHGGWVWRGVSAQLMGMGHKVIVPCLTAGRVGNEATLSSYVAEILMMLSHAPQKEVVVVTQSYGGLIATAVAARMPSRISCLLYVDAVLPEHGKSMLETVPPEFSKNYRDRRSMIDGMDVIIPPLIELGVIGGCRLASMDCSTRPKVWLHPSLRRSMALEAGCRHDACSVF